MKKKLKKLMNILLGIALVMGLVPEMGFTVYANDTKAYAAYDVTTEANKTKSGNELKELQVSFNGIPWYIIKDDSIAADEGTVTLLAADTSFGTCAFDDTSSSSSYGSSTVKKRLDELTETGSFKSMAKFIADTDLTDVNVTKAKLFLLSFQEADTLPAEVKKTAFTGENCEQGEWWTRSKDTDMRAICIVGGTGGGNIDNNSPNIANAYGVRPALRLDLSKVIFSTETRKFSPDPAVFPYSYLMDTTTTVSFNNCDWYVIADDSTAVDAGTVTLLAAGTEFGTSKFASASNSYNKSDVKGYLEKIVSGTAGEGEPDFNGVAAAIQKVTLTTYKINSTVVSETTNDAQMFLLSTEEAKALPKKILKSGFDYWWLRSPGSYGDHAAFVNGEDGDVDENGSHVEFTLGVRPALKLNLSSVIFSSDTNTFSLKTSHTHSFSYSASGETITATCTADGCDLPVVDNKHIATLTIAASGGTYDGTTAYGATITDDSSIRGEAKVLYRKKTDGSYGTATETAPTGAGDYKASITVGGATASVEYTIGKADPTANAPTGLTATYGQTLADVSLEGKNPEGNTPGTWAWVDSTKSVGNVVIPAATFKANFTPTSSNYNTVENVDVSVTVSKANAVPATVTANNRAYDGTDNPLVTITGTATGGEMQYAPGTATEATESYTTSIPTATNAGTYYVWYKVVGDGNHRDTEEKCVEVTIAEDKKEEKKEEEKKEEEKKEEEKKEEEKKEEEKKEEEKKEEEKKEEEKKEEEKKEEKKEEEKKNEDEKKADEGGGSVTPSAKKEITVFDNEPLAYSEETKGDFRIGYCHEIPFAGKGKLTVESFGENFTVLQGNESYKVKKIKANKKKHRIQILKLENAPKDVEKDVKKATKGDNGIPYTQNPYYVRDTDKVTPKFKKSGAAASVKVNINGKDYKAKKTEYEYNEASKIFKFKGDNLAGSWAVK